MTDLLLWIAAAPLLVLAVAVAIAIAFIVGPVDELSVDERTILARGRELES